MKVCSKCKIEKDDVEFAFRSRLTGTKHSQCDICRRITAKNSYIQNKDKILQKAIDRNRQNKIDAKEWKSKLYCVSCGENYIQCLDFHHLDPTKKDKNVSSLIGSYNIKSVISEASKCVVVCANCHRKIHSNILQITNLMIETSRVMMYK